MLTVGITIARLRVDPAGGNDPLAAIRSVNTLAGPDGTAILVLQNFHRFLQSAEIVQALARQITLGKQNRTFVVILSPMVQIPTELEKLFVVLEHELPSREQLAEIARGIATEDEELPDGSELETVLEYFQAQGKSVGLVTTTYITHATPAAFGAHEPARGNYSQRSSA